MNELMKRDDMDIKFQWDLTKSFPSDEDWKIEFEKTLNELEDFPNLEKDMTSSAESFLEVINIHLDLKMKCDHIHVYALLKYFQDMSNAVYLDLYNKSESMNRKYDIIFGFFEPSILLMGEEKVYGFISSINELEIYKQYIHDIFRRAKHTLSGKEEELLASAKAITKLPTNIFDLIENEEIKFENSIDKEGNEVEVTHGNFKKLMTSEDKVLRESAYNSVFGAYSSFKKSLASAYAGTIKNEAFFAKARGYNSSLEASLYENNITKEVYTNLIDTVDNNLSSLHKYHEISKKVLGVEKLKPYNLNVPLIKNVDYKVTYEEAKKIALACFAPLGEDYIRKVELIFDSKYIDVYENKGKISGAYSFTAYGMPPYIIMSYVDNLSSLFTLVHELGHSVHTLFTSANQPFVYGSYTLFTAEIAATTHEALLIQYLMKTTKDKKLKAYFLNYYITKFLGTFFRQTMFAEFEMKAHELEANNIRIDDVALSNIYKELLKKYFGEHLEIDDKIIHEWTRISHFHKPFYVYQYATGFASAVAIAKAILANEEGAVERYISMLKKGSSEYSIPMLSKAGVDMTTSKPIQDALDVFKDLVDELERLVKPAPSSTII